MAVTYTWDITYIKKLDSANGFINPVVKVGWKKTGTDENGLVGVFEGSIDFKLDSIDPATYVPFESLTKEMVLGWIQSRVVGGYELVVNEKIQQQIDKQKGTPVELLPGQLPWETT